MKQINKREIHLKIKQSLGSKLSLENYLNKKEKIDSIYKDGAKDVFAVPSDICDLGIANDCAIRGYVDFHTRGHVEQSISKIPNIARRLNNIF